MLCNQKLRVIANIRPEAGRATNKEDTVCVCVCGWEGGGGDGNKTHSDL